MEFQAGMDLRVLLVILVKLVNHKTINISLRSPNFRPIRPTWT